MFPAGHLSGAAPLVEVVQLLLKERVLRQERGEGGARVRLPLRPDHGLAMLADRGRQDVIPGHTAIGRLRGLAEIRGVQAALSLSLAAPTASC